MERWDLLQAALEGLGSITDTVWIYSSETLNINATLTIWYRYVLKAERELDGLI